MCLFLVARKPEPLSEGRRRVLVRDSSSRRESVSAGRPAVRSDGDLLQGSFLFCGWTVLTYDSKSG